MSPGVGETSPEDMATVDHLLDRRFRGDRAAYGRGEMGYVLACLRCNSERGRATESVRDYLEWTVVLDRWLARHERTVEKEIDTCDTA